MSAAGKYFIDGKDFFTIFSVTVESGSDDFLRYPSAKPRITRDWADANGLDIDTSQVFFNARDISLRCAIIADTPEQFWERHSGFIAQWAIPGYHRLQISEFGLRSFYCIYKDTSVFKRETPVREGVGIKKTAVHFTLNILEVEPTLNTSDEFIVTEDGHFIVT